MFFGFQTNVFCTVCDANEIGNHEKQQKNGILHIFVFLMIDTVTV